MFFTYRHSATAWHPLGCSSWQSDCSMCCLQDWPVLPENDRPRRAANRCRPLGKSRRFWTSPPTSRNPISERRQNARFQIGKLHKISQHTLSGGKFANLNDFLVIQLGKDGVFRLRRLHARPVELGQFVPKIHTAFLNHLDAFLYFVW